MVLISISKRHFERISPFTIFCKVSKSCKDGDNAGMRAVNGSVRLRPRGRPGQDPCNLSRMSRYRGDVQCSSEAASGSLGPSRIESRSGFDPSPTPTFELGLRGPGFSSRDAKRRDETGRGGAAEAKLDARPSDCHRRGVAESRSRGGAGAAGVSEYRSRDTDTATFNKVRPRQRGFAAGRPQPQPPHSALVRFPRTRLGAAKRGPAWPSGQAEPHPILGP